MTPGTEAVASDPLVDEARAAPTLLTVVVTETQAREWTEGGFGLLEGRVSSNGRSTAYLCTDFVCRLPMVEPSDLELALRPV